MSYPGDQQQPGGWGPSQPPSSPYGPGDDQAGHGGPPFGGPRDDPYGGPPRDGGFGPGGGGAGGYGGSFGDERSEPYGNAFEPNPSYDSYESHDENADPYGGGPGGYGPEDDFGSGSGSGSGRKKLIIGAAIAVGVIVVAGGAAFALTSGGDDKPKTEAAQPSAPPATPTPTPTPSPTETGRGDRLQSRTTDPRPLTLNEIFKARSFKAGGRRYLMTARRAERKCAPPTHGTKFRKALAKGGCTQVLRATFSNGKLIGTIGVINLRTQAAATSAQSASKTKDAFILALPGSGTTKKIGQGLSLTTTEVNGHYLIMSWVQYPNGKQIAKGDYSAVTSFVKYTTYGSNLRTALNYRSMEGKPS
ncbi:hypothetical protein [Actinoallomurus sp. CA-142502]|uniref:hypothetical protein n=1 Tax=Actinoallomurus sp. CA-142502 TaxID=3239885 RepID=UPI003D8AB467